MEHTITELFQHYAYSPGLVYFAITAFMIASAFGLPCPEELILISAGLVGYASLNSVPGEGDVEIARINVYVLATYCFLVVIGSDFLIYTLGKHVASRIIRSAFFSRLIKPQVTDKIQLWIKKYSYGAVLAFRFTPGVRFPGHLMCGAMGLSPWKFLLTDALAAGISVPTQVLLVSFYGNDILVILKKFKLVVLSLFAIGLVIYLIYRWTEKRRAQNAAGVPALKAISSAALESALGQTEATLQNAQKPSASDAGSASLQLAEAKPANADASTEEKTSPAEASLRTRDHA